MKRLLTIVVLTILAALPSLAEQCGELPCTYLMVPMRALGEALGFRADFDQVQIFTRTEDPAAKAFLVRVRYRWRGQAAESDHVMLRWPDGAGVLTMHFLDVREVEIESIEIRTLGCLR